MTQQAFVELKEIAIEYLRQVFKQSPAETPPPYSHVVNAAVAIVLAPDPDPPKET